MCVCVCAFACVLEKDLVELCSVGLELGANVIAQRVIGLGFADQLDQFLAYWFPVFVGCIGLFHGEEEIKIFENKQESNPG